MFSQAKVNTQPYTHTHTSVCARYFHADVGACADIDVLLSVYSSPSFMILEAVMLSWSPETSQQPGRSRTQPRREEEGGGGGGGGGGGRGG